MTTQRRWRTLLAGCALIVLVNALALGGAAYNRAGEPDSLLLLSERELLATNGRWLSPENDGMVLTLAWRVLPTEGSDNFHRDWAFFGGSPAWLDQRKMQSLGFELPEQSPITSMTIRRPRSREVLLVLELDGPTYQQALNLARQQYAEESRLRAANPEKREFVQRRDDAQKRLQREETQNSRLFVVDAGLDVAALRAQYPDKTRYLIARGRVHAQWRSNAPQPTLYGRIDRLTISEISVPVELRTGLSRRDLLQQPTPFQATVAFGKRLEPWLQQIKVDSKSR